MKKIKIISVFIFIIFLLFMIFCYRNFYFGNNNGNKSASQIRNLILNIKEYEAEIEVNVESNKNSNKYVLKQKFKSDDYENQVVVKPENIEGLSMSYCEGVLKIDNTKLNLSKIYEGYPYLSSNVLCLSSFIEDCRNNMEKLDFFEENNQWVFSLNYEKNKYSSSRRLYVEKGSGTPKKMIVQDYNNNDIIYIVYNNISFNT